MTIGEALTKAGAEYDRLAAETADKLCVDVLAAGATPGELEALLIRHYRAMGESRGAFLEQTRSAAERASLTWDA